MALILRAAADLEKLEFMRFLGKVAVEVLDLAEMLSEHKKRRRFASEIATSLIRKAMGKTMVVHFGDRLLDVTPCGVRLLPDDGQQIGARFTVHPDTVTCPECRAAIDKMVST